MPNKHCTSDKSPESPPDKIDELNAWGRDQEQHRYYYDDAHGYEKYDPDAEDDDEECGGGR